MYDAVLAAILEAWGQNVQLEFKQAVRHNSIVRDRKRTNPADRFAAYGEHLDRCIARLRMYLFYRYAGPNSPSLQEGIPSTHSAPDTKRVFIAYGRDRVATLEVSHYLHNLKVEPILLEDEAGRSRTIIEKLEDVATSVKYAVILLTPDDQGALRGKMDTPSVRARQNVFIECGFFLGLIGRNHMCLLRKGNVEIPSDLAGIEHVALDDAGEWKVKLRRELEAAQLL